MRGCMTLYRQLKIENCSLQIDICRKPFQVLLRRSLSHFFFTMIFDRMYPSYNWSLKALFQASANLFHF